MSISLRSLTTHRSILLQVAAVFVLCQVFAHAVTFAFIVWRYERPDLLAATSVSTIQALGFHDVLKKASDSERPALEAAIQRAQPNMRVLPDQSLSLQPLHVVAGNMMMGGLIRAKPEFMPIASLVAVRSPDGSLKPNQPDLIALEIGAGKSLVFDPEEDAKRVNVPRVIAAVFGTALLVPLLLLPIWAALLLTAPLRRLAMSAERFSIDLDPTPLPEQGPAEIRKLANAFNLMRARIRQLIESRSRMFAAVSHDLRTPLTRIRLRVESLLDGDDKERTLRDIGTMNTMISQVLSYLRDQASPAARERVDLSTLLESIRDDFSDTGHAVRFEGPRNIVLECEPDLMTRALSNIVDNSVKFSGEARIFLETRSAAQIAIRIEDDGPGIPDDRKIMAFEPFSRGDDARGSVEHEGFGLGLAIAKQIIERHGGQITLHDRVPQGLRVQILLPVNAENQTLADHSKSAHDDQARAGSEKAA